MNGKAAKRGKWRASPILPKLVRSETGRVLTGYSLDIQWFCPRVLVGWSAIYVHDAYLGLPRALPKPKLASRRIAGDTTRTVGQ